MRQGRDTETNKNRLVWQAYEFAQYISQLWVSLAGEQIVTEASAKSFNLSNCYQEDVKHEYPNVRDLFPPHCSSICSIWVSF